MPKNEDKEVNWEKRKSEVEEERQIRKAFTTDIGNDADKFLAILTGNYQPVRLPTDSDRIFKHSDNQPTVSRKLPKFAMADDGDEDEEELHEPEPLKVANRTPSVNKYAEFTEQLERFPFIKDQAKRKELTATVIAAIRVGLNDTIMQEVAKNTKKAFTDHCKKIVKTTGGLKVIFNFGGNDILVTAKGAFYGDETICVHNKGGKTVPAVIKVVGDNYADLTSEFDLTIGTI